MKIIKFSISSDFGMFKQGNNWMHDKDINKDTSGKFIFNSYIFPHFPFILGLLGAAYGFKGYSEYQSLTKTIEKINNENYLNKFQKEKEQSKSKVNEKKIKELNIKIEKYNFFINEIFEKINNFELDFFNYFKNKLYIGVEIHNIPIISNYYLTNTKKDGIVSKKGNTYVWLNDVIENPSYSFYFYGEDYFIDEIQSKLENPYYTLKMGKNRFIINDFNVQKIEDFNLINDNEFFINSNILIKEKDIIEDNTFVNINDFIPFSYDKINHNNFDKCCVSFDKDDKIKIQLKDESICVNMANKNVVLYKVKG